MQRTPFARLVETKLRAAKKISRDASLSDWLRERREEGLSWRAVALEITLVTGETPTDMTVSSWYDEPAKREDGP